MTLKFVTLEQNVASEEIDGVTVIYREGAPMPDPDMTWQDILDRNPQAYVAPPEPAPPTIDELRAEAFISRDLFLERAVTAGYITKSERLQALQNQWPTSLQPVLTGLPEDEALDAQIHWARSQYVSRVDPTFIFIADFKLLTETQRDELFGVGEAP